jgi:membrane-associated protease RseP (regulator of RpoE activity)
MLINSQGRTVMLSRLTKCGGVLVAVTLVGLLAVGGTAHARPGGGSVGHPGGRGQGMGGSQHHTTGSPRPHTGGSSMRGTRQRSGAIHSHHHHSHYRHHRHSIRVVPGVPVQPYVDDAADDDADGDATPVRLGISGTAVPRGVRVDEVAAGGLGDDMGLEAGDVIVEVNGRSTATVDDIRSTLDESDGGVALLVINHRTGQYQRLEN